MKGVLRAAARIAASVLILAVAAAGAAAAATVLLSAAPSGGATSKGPVSAEPDGSAVYELRPGESATSAGRNLEAAGLIRSALLWNMVSRVDPVPLKAGTYRLPAGSSLFEIREILVSGKQMLVRVTVPEGFTLRKTAAALEAAGVVGAADFLAAAEDRSLLDRYGVQGPSMEGYLFPDTYLFPRSYPARRVVAAMADAFFERLYSIAPETRSWTAQAVHERVVVASIVEREYRAADEAPLMAGVFLNRIRIGMALQSCATVEYVITEIQGRPHPEVLYNRDLEIPSPYNTYRQAGLPPGPIAAPGRVALDAAFRPKATDYLYFRLVDPAEGRHRFSRTLGDHAAAGKLYLKSSSGTR